MELGSAHARVGFVGNPSDGYGGKVLAFALADFAAHVRVESARAFSAASSPPASTLDALLDQLAAARTRPDEASLLLAAIAELADRAATRRVRPFRVTLTTDIPRQVGLAGSSAIVIATLRALAPRFGLVIAPNELAQLALHAETERLGIAAGPQDRVIQAYGGLRFMDFSAARERGRGLDPDLLPPMFVAWQPGPGAPSGVTHDDLRRRFEAGDRLVRTAMRRFAEFADAAVEALEADDRELLIEILNANFDTRASICAVGARDRELVDLGRSFGAGVKLCGSGGAVVGVVRDADELPAIEAAYAAANHGTLRPTVARTIEA